MKKRVNKVARFVKQYIKGMVKNIFTVGGRNKRDGEKYLYCKRKKSIAFRRFNLKYLSLTILQQKNEVTRNKSNKICGRPTLKAS